MLLLHCGVTFHHQDAKNTKQNEKNGKNGQFQAGKATLQAESTFVS